MIDYKSAGELISSVRIRKEDNLHIVFVKNGDMHIVSKYWNGSIEWCNGHYFKDYHEAHAYFVTEVLETLPITNIHSPKKLPALVAKLHKFLGVLAGAES